MRPSTKASTCRAGADCAASSPAACAPDGLNVGRGTRRTEDASHGQIDTVDGALAPKTWTRILENRVFGRVSDRGRSRRPQSLNLDLRLVPAPPNQLARIARTTPLSRGGERAEKGRRGGFRGGRTTSVRVAADRGGNSTSLRHLRTFSLVLLRASGSLPGACLLRAGGHSSGRQGRTHDEHGQAD